MQISLQDPLFATYAIAASLMILKAVAMSSRLLHFAAYLGARTHDTRATLWTVGSLILVFMTVRALLTALGAIG